jgi:glycosyltransferase involved in cell wall biosynthesis
MRVLQINNFHFIKGGADRVYLNTSKLLADNGHLILNFSSINTANNKSDESRFFVEINDNRHSNLGDKLRGVKNYIYNKKVYRNLEALIKEKKPDIAHLHLYYGGLTSSVLKVLKDMQVPIVQTIHDYRLLCPANAFLDNKNRICEKCKNRFYLQCSIYRCLEDNFFYSSILTIEAYTRKYFIDPLDYVDHFIFVSKFSQHKHIEYNKRFQDKSSLLYNFTFIPELWSVNTNKDYVLFFGRLSKEKGILTLLQAIKKTKLKLKIAGTGPLQKYVENSTLDNKNIEFLGHKSGDELKQLITGASYIVVPSEWYENNPMTVIESYAYGRPVIGSEIGGIPEIVENNKTGFLFKSRNIDDLAKTLEVAGSTGDAEYSRLSHNARNFAEENFSPQSHYSNLINTYSNILKI